MDNQTFYNCLFHNSLGETLVIMVKDSCTIKDLIHLYFKRKGKDNLFINNIEKTYFIYNSILINYEDNENTVSSLFTYSLNPNILVSRLDYDKTSEDIKENEIDNKR